MFSNNSLSKICQQFYCEKCDYATSKKSSYIDHLNSKKHNKSIISNEILPIFCHTFICTNCNKKYKDNSGLWRHKKTCLSNKEEIIKSTQNTGITPEMFYDLLNQNNELTKQLIELSKEKLNDLHLPKNCRLINLD